MNKNLSKNPALRNIMKDENSILLAVLNNGKQWQKHGLDKGLRR